jgi:hypothetical protein
MGGLSVLLVIAAMGITYGWQPDDNGGVEYIIQIPPDQLHEIERVGEISSLIDPAVRGHVSRVIVQVGNGPLQRRTPANFARKLNPQPDRGVIAASDQSPVPIPEMGDHRQATPIPSLDPAENTPAAVMKPDANDSNGPGFSFPSLPSTLRDTAATAGNTLRAQASNNRVQPHPNTTQTRQPQAPRFTGSDPTGELARTRPGGPTTDPAGNRDNTWRGFATNQAGGPSTDPVGSNVAANNRFDPRSLNAQDRAAADALSSRRGATGLSPNDTFGKLPSGLSLPAAANQPSAGYTRGNLNTQANATRGVNPQTANLQTPNSQTGVYSQYEQTQLDLQTRNANNKAYGQSQYDPATRNQAPANNYNQATANAQGSNYSQTGIGGYNNQSPAYSTRDEQVPQTRMGPDSRLTRQQVDAGAWSVDIYNRPIDRDGKLIEVTSPTAAVYGSDPRQQTGLYPDRTYSTLGQPNVSQPRMAETSTSNQQTQPRTGSYGYNPPLPANTRLVNENGQTVSSDLIRQTRPANDVQFDPPSLSNRRTASVLGGSVSSGGIQSPRQVAAQPLFNGLLLVSFVANIYLIFWLKNLRVQFRDLVAAKRIANSSSQTA